MGYWTSRQHLDYYRRIRELLELLGPRESILDVGCFDTPVAAWGDFTRRYTLDDRERPDLPGVIHIHGRWPDDMPAVPLPVSVITCLQVLEHLDDPLPFAEQLFASAADMVILSVPYRWPANATHYHVHDPIDEAKLARLVGRPPSSSVIVRDPGGARLIATYNLTRTSNIT